MKAISLHSLNKRLKYEICLGKIPSINISTHLPQCVLLFSCFLFTSCSISLPGCWISVVYFSLINKYRNVIHFPGMKDATKLNFYSGYINVHVFDGGIR